MNNFVKTKIVCTIGPSCNSPAMIESLIEAGMNVARLNFSHGTLSSHETHIKNIRAIAERLKKPVAIIQDLSGPKIRISSLSKESVTLKANDLFTLTNRNVEDAEKTASVNYALLHEIVFVDDAILLNDGVIELKVVQKNNTDIICHVVVGGELTVGKGLNIPGRSLPIPSLTEKDLRDLDFGIRQEVDYIALSFVKNVDDVLQLKKLIQQKNKDIPVIAKIEKHEALNDLENIIKTADAIMVARGDLGVEIPLERIPIVQKKIIRLANTFCKPVITATQMLESMVHNYRPTRAEVTDVANAIFDGTDAVMLSEETAKGRYPVEAVHMLSKIAREVEPCLSRKNNFEAPHSPNNPISVPDAISIATCQVADNLDIKAIITSTQTGSTARFISKYRPQHLILAVTPSLNTYKRLSLVWGVIPMLTEPMQNTDDMMKKAIEAAKAAGYISEKDRVAITGGVPVWEPGSTNLLRIY